MELPKWKAPSLKRAFWSMMERAKAYIIKAATIILVCNLIVTLMQTFNWHFQVVEEGMENTSILATIATPFAILLIPLGCGVWQLAAAAVTGFIAKENVVGTLAVVYGLPLRLFRWLGNVVRTVYAILFVLFFSFCVSYFITQNIKMCSQGLKFIELMILLLYQGHT